MTGHASRDRRPYNDARERSIQVLESAFYYGHCGEPPVPRNGLKTGAGFDEVDFDGTTGEMHHTTSAPHHKGPVDSEGIIIGAPGRAMVMPDATRMFWLRQSLGLFGDVSIGHLLRPPPWVPEALHVEWREGTKEHRQHLSALTWDPERWPACSADPVQEWERSEAILRLHDPDPVRVRAGEKHTYELLPGEVLEIRADCPFDIWSTGPGTISWELGADTTISAPLDSSRRILPDRGYARIKFRAPARVRLVSVADASAPSTPEPYWRTLGLSRWSAPLEEKP